MLIASMAAIWARRATLQQVVDSLLAQTRPPQAVLIHYSDEPWHLDDGWTQPPVLRSHPAIELVKVPNRGSCRKFLFALASCAVGDDTIVLVDDDRAWHPTVVERVVQFVSTSDRVATTRGWSKYATGVDGAGALTFHTLPIHGTQVSEPTPVHVASSGWATCFRRKDVEAALFSESLQEEFQLRYSDEVFLSAMLRPTICVVPMPSGYFSELASPVDQWRSCETSAAKVAQLELLKRYKVPSTASRSDSDSLSV
jgi:GT2 family glycosyltransferase